MNSLVEVTLPSSISSSCRLLTRPLLFISDTHTHREGPLRPVSRTFVRVMELISLTNDKQNIRTSLVSCSLPTFSLNLSPSFDSLISTFSFPLLNLVPGVLLLSLLTPVTLPRSRLFFFPLEKKESHDLISLFPYTLLSSKLHLFSHESNLTHGENSSPKYNQNK